MDKSWMDKKRNTREYFEGVKKFVEFASLTACNGRIPCPCNRCVHGKLFLTKVVRDHLYSYGILTNYRPWVFHGESWLATTPTKGGSMLH